MSFFIPILALSIGWILSAPAPVQAQEPVTSANVETACSTPAFINEAKWWMKSRNYSNRKDGFNVLLVCNDLAIAKAKLAASTSHGDYMDRIRSDRAQGLDTGGSDLVRKLSAVSSNGALDRLYLERDQIFNAYTR